MTSGLGRCAGLCLCWDLKRLDEEIGETCMLEVNLVFLPLGELQSSVPRAYCVSAGTWEGWMRDWSHMHAGW